MIIFINCFRLDFLDICVSFLPEYKVHLHQSSEIIKISGSLYWFAMNVNENKPKFEFRKSSEDAKFVQLFISASSHFVVCRTNGQNGLQISLSLKDKITNDIQTIVSLMMHSNNFLSCSALCISRIHCIVYQ